MQLIIFVNVFFLATILLIVFNIKRQSAKSIFYLEFMLIPFLILIIPTIGFLINFLTGIIYNNQHYIYVSLIYLLFVFILLIANHICEKKDKRFYKKNYNKIKRIINDNLQISNELELTIQNIIINRKNSYIKVILNSPIEYYQNASSFILIKNSIILIIKNNSNFKKIDIIFEHIKDG